jgi:hypothetical protein
MFGKTVVGFPVPAHNLMLLPFHTACHFFDIFGCISEQSLDQKKFGIMPNYLTVYRIDCTLTERKIINGIQQIGLTHPVLSYKTIDLGRKIQIDLLKILVIKYVKLLKIHNIPV